MSFSVGDIPLYREYIFTDTKEIRKGRFALILLPDKATQYQGSNLCCVITKNPPQSWGFKLIQKKYPFFSLDSFACINRKDFQSKNDLGGDPQPKGNLDKSDLKDIYKVLRKSLFVIKDLASDFYIRGTIIREWKVAINDR